MSIQFFQRIKLVGLVVSMAALSYQPAMQAASSQTGISQSVATISDDDRSVEGLGKLLAMPSQVAQAVASGGAQFVGAAHPTTGAAQIVEVDGQRYLEFDAAFRSDDGPDLFVLLHTQAVPESYAPEDFVNLGRLQEIEGAQRYAIPDDVDIESLQSAVIWCQQFDVTFGYATF